MRPTVPADPLGVELPQAHGSEPGPVSMRRSRTDLLPTALVARAFGAALAEARISGYAPIGGLPECARLWTLSPSSGDRAAGAEVLLPPARTQSLAIITHALSRRVRGAHRAPDVVHGARSLRGRGPLGHALPVDDEGLEVGGWPTPCFVQPGLLYSTCLPEPHRRELFTRAARRAPGRRPEAPAPRHRGRLRAELAFGESPDRSAPPRGRTWSSTSKALRSSSPRPSASGQSSRPRVTPSPSRARCTGSIRSSHRDPAGARSVPDCTGVRHPPQGAYRRASPTARTPSTARLERTNRFGARWTVRPGLCAWMELPPRVRADEFVATPPGAACCRSGRLFCLDESGSAGYGSLSPPRRLESSGVRGIIGEYWERAHGSGAPRLDAPPARSRPTPAARDPSARARCSVRRAREPIPLTHRHIPHPARSPRRRGGRKRSVARAPRLVQQKEPARSEQHAAPGGVRGRTRRPERAGELHPRAEPPAGTCPPCSERGALQACGRGRARVGKRGGKRLEVVSNAGAVRHAASARWVTWRRTDRARAARS